MPSPSISARRTPPPRPAARPEPDHRGRSLALLIFVVCLITLVIFWPARQARTLMFDDESYLTVNHLVQKPSWYSAWRFLSEVLHPSTVGGYYQPLAMISLMLDYIRAGSPENFEPFHTTSLLLHVLNTALVMVLVHQIFQSLPAAALAGLIFGVHPMHVESVAWVAERKSVLAATFALAALIAYVGYARRGNWPAYVATTGLFVLALLSKPTTTPLPAVMLLMDFWPLRRWSRRAIFEKIPLFALAAVSAIITVVSQRNTADITPPNQYPHDAIPLVLCHNIVFYLHKMLVPLNLSGYYDYPRPWGFFHPALLWGVVGTLLLAALLVVSLRWTRSLAIGWLIFFAAIFPTMGVIGFTAVIAADRFVYLPMIGLLFPLAAGLTAVWAKGDGHTSRFWVLGAVLIVAGLYAVQTRRYIEKWRDTETFHRHMLRDAPLACSVHMGLGNDLQKQEKHVEALEEFRVAVECDPEFAPARVNYGYGLEKMGRIEEAQREYLAALEVKPDLAEAHNFLANFLVTQGKIDEAMERYQTSLRLKPENSRLRHNFATMLATIGRREEAVEQFRIALDLDPLAPKSLFNLGLTYLQMNRLDEATAALRKAVELNPAYIRARYQLGVALIRNSKVAEGLVQWRQAGEMQPGWAEILAETAWILATSQDLGVRDPVEALRLAQLATRIANQPDGRFLDVLAAAQARAGDFQSAVTSADEGVAILKKQGDAAQAARVQGRLNGYRAGRAYESPPNELIRNLVRP